MDAEPAAPTREIRNIALLDLTGASSADVLDGIQRISKVATILVPEGLVGRLSQIPMEKVAATVPIPDGKRVKVLSGQVSMSGEALANTDGQRDEVLVVAGQLVITTPVQCVGYDQLIVMGQILAPVGSETGLGSGLTRVSGQVLYYPYTPDAKVKMLTGSLRLSGADLANAYGQPNDILLAAGEVLITGPVERVGFAQIIAVGQLIAPRESESVLAGRLTVVGDGVTYYSGTPRVFDGADSFSRAFFDLLAGPTTLVLNGTTVFEDDVTLEAVRAKVVDIILNGSIRAPRALVPLLQVLCVACHGTITPNDAAE